MEPCQCLAAGYCGERCVCGGAGERDAETAGLECRCDAFGGDSDYAADERLDRAVDDDRDFEWRHGL